MSLRAERPSVNRQSIVRLLLAGLACVASIVSGCGGGGGGDVSQAAAPAADSVPPAVSISSSAAGTSASAAITFTFSGSEGVGTSFTSDDVSVSGGTPGAWTRIDATRFTLLVTPPANGSGSTVVSVAAGRATDLAGNVNTASASLSQPYDTRLAGWTLVWADEFDVAGLPDAAKWDYDTERNKVGWFNNELQYYARNRLGEARVEDGKLIITARRERLATALRTSGARVHIGAPAHARQGRLDLRLHGGARQITLQPGHLAGDLDAGHRRRWPDDGEIDIMENITGSDKTQDSGHDPHAGLQLFRRNAGRRPGRQHHVGDACTSFHNYQLTWNADRILIGVDDTGIWSIDNPKTVTPRAGRSTTRST